MTDRFYDATYIRIAEFARDLHTSTRNSDVVIAELVNFAAVVIPGAQHAAITTVRQRQAIETPASTGEYPILMDKIQQSCGDGPCVTAAVDEPLVEIVDMETDERWPQYQTAVLQLTPIRSLMSFHLFGLRHSRASFNVYAERAHAFDDQSRSIASIFATHTAFTWDSARSQEQFQEALASRDIIGQAKGMVMERYSIDAQQSFELLRTLSQDTNTPVAVLAQRLVETDHPKKS